MNQRLLPVIVLLAVVGLGVAFGAYGLLPEQAGANPDDNSGITPTPTATGTANAPLIVFTTGEGDDITLEAADDQIVRGETELEPGTQLTVRLQDANTSSPFLYSAETTVQEDGTFAATYDLSTVSGPAAFTAVVRHDGEQITTTAGEIVATETGSGTPATDGDGPSIEFVTAADGTVTLRPADQQAVGGTTDLPAGTKLVVRLRSSGADHPFLKSAETTVAEDGRFRVTFNMSSIEGGTSFRTSVRNDDGDLLVRAPGEVIEEA